MKKVSPFPRRVLSSRCCQLVLVLSLAGCTATPLKLPSEQDVETARQNGTLETMLSDLKLRSVLDPNAAKLSKQIAEILGSEKLVAAMALLEQAQVAGFTPIASLNMVSPQVESIAKFSESAATELKTYLAGENEKTNAYIRAANASIADSEAAISEQLDYAQTVSRLNGQDPQVLTAKLLSNAYNRANNLEVDGNYELAYDKWKALVKAAPDYEDTVDRLNQVSGTFNVRKFNGFMEAGDVASATALYTRLAGDGIDVSSLEDGAQQLIGYFALQAEAALEDEILSEAYSAAKQIKQIEAAGAGNGYQNPIATAVLEALILRSELYLAQDREGMALGTAIAAAELAPNDPLTAELAAKLVDNLYDKSITRLSLGQFSGTDAFPQLGNRISSLIKEGLVASELKTIRLIERDKLQSVFVEKELIAMKGGEVNVTVEPADIVVQGEVLAASIDITRQAKRKTKRAVVEIKETLNPGYAEWDALSDSKKAKRDAPEEFLKENIKEDISLNSQIIRKDGLLSAAYRLINPVLANIISYQSLEEVNQYTGESIDGVEIGLFVQESQDADVPSDGQVMAELAAIISGKISTQLVERFADPVSVFTSDASAYLAKENIVAASLELGKAYSYLIKMGEEAADLKVQLRDTALNSSAYIEE